MQEWQSGRAMLYVWLLLSCSTAHAHAIAVRPRDVKIRGIAAPVRIYEAESQDAALDAARAESAARALSRRETEPARNEPLSVGSTRPLCAASSLVSF